MPSSEDRPVRSLAALVAVVLAVAAGLSVVAAAATSNGLPAYTNGYATWQKLNKRPITAPGPMR